MQKGEQMGKLTGYLGSGPGPRGIPRSGKAGRKAESTCSEEKAAESALFKKFPFLLEKGRNGGAPVTVTAKPFKRTKQIVHYVG